MPRVHHAIHSLDSSFQTVWLPSGVYKYLHVTACDIFVVLLDSYIIWLLPASPAIITLACMQSSTLITVCAMCAFLFSRVPDTSLEPRIKDWRNENFTRGQR